jgi:hypothetical protein
LIKIALYGELGAGKSTFSELLGQEFAAIGTLVLQVQLAAPLHALQSLIHVLAGRPLPESCEQETALLNDLAGHMRRINPNALTDALARRVAQAAATHPHGVVLCDDAHAPEVERLPDLGFTLIEVWAPDEIRRARTGVLGEFPQPAHNDASNARPLVEPHHRVINDCSLDQLRTQAAELVRKVTS